jgi:tRNA pseudouridine55 synthase
VPTGIILLDKPRGLTSNGALQRIRKAFGAESAGHVGTLDPMATGMLPVCLDEATKVIAEIEGGAKSYEFTLSLGSRTDTGDAEGRVIESLPVPGLTSAAIEAALADFRGVLQQVPPMYSALKREGRPLYELARQGKEVERAARTIEIRRFELVAARDDALDLACECAKGTYIRVLGEDLARRLGTCGHLTRLRRAWVEPFRDVPMVSLEEALAGSQEVPRPEWFRSPDAALGHLESVSFDSEGVTRLRHGQPARAVAGSPKCGSRARLYDPQGEFLGLGEVLPDGRLQPRRLLRTLHS